MQVNRRARSGVVSLDDIQQKRFVMSCLTSRWTHYFSMLSISRQTHYLKYRNQIPLILHVAESIRHTT